MRIKTQLGRAAIVSAILVSVGAGNPKLVAETRSKKEPASEPAAAKAQWRIWKDQLASKRSLRIVYRPSAKRAASSEVRLGAEGWQFLDYVEVASGTGTIDISDDAEPKKKLLSLPISTSAGSFVTLLLHETDGQIDAELVDDTAPSAASHAAEITIRNFVPTLATLQVHIGDDFTAKLISSESFLHVRGLPRKSVIISSSGTDEAGKPIKWVNEVDFSKIRRATVLIYPDSHGRIRPRVAVDGELAARPSAEESDQGAPH